MNKELITRTPEDIKNNFKEIRELCNQEPISIVVDGKEDTVLMSYESYIKLVKENNSIQR